MMLSYLPSLSKTTFERSSLIPSCHALCRTRLRARNAAHDGEHIRQSSTIFLCLQSLGMDRVTEGHIYMVKMLMKIQKTFSL